MKKIDISLIYDAIVRRKGLNPADDPLTAAQKGDYAELVTERLKIAWEEAIWPDVRLVEQRQFRPDWDAAVSYSEDDEILYTDGDDESAYYISLQDGNLNQQPDEETDYWEAAGDTFVRNIDFDQEDETEIDGVDVEDCAFDYNPRIYPDRGRVFQITINDGVILFRADQAPVKPWIRFRPVSPEFSWTEWVAATEYSIGDLTYLAAQGECYKALAPSTGKDPYTETAYWEPVGFPKIFRDYVVNGVTADLLTEDEGRFKAESKATAELQRMVDTMIDQPAERRRASYRRS